MLYLPVLVLGFLVLTLLGISGSSVGVPFLQPEPGIEAPGHIIGTPRAIRSDEFMRVTPWRVGLMHSGSEDFLSPLTDQRVGIVTNAVPQGLEWLVYFDSDVLVTLGRALPSVAYAFVWWLPLLLVAALTPLWFRMLGVAWNLAIAGGLLFILAPVAAWWSWGPVNAVCWVIVSAVSLLGASYFWRKSRWNITSLGLLALSILTGSRFLLGYLPWVLVLGLITVLPTLGHLLWEKSTRKRNIALSCITIIGSLLLTAAVYLQNSSAFKAMASTVYPGQRRSSGVLESLAMLFGAPHLWILQRSPDLIGINASELSTAFFVLIVPSALLLLAFRRQLKSQLGLSFVLVLSSVALLSTWVMFDWPTSTQAIPIISLIPPNRLVAVIGFGALIAFILGLALARQTNSQSSRWLLPIVASWLTFLVLLAGGSNLSSAFLPALTPPLVAMGAALFSGCVFVITRWPRSTLAVVPIVVFAALTTIAVNPLQQGFASLIGSSTTDTLVGIQTSSAGLWAADDFTFDPVFMANAIPALSGQQWVGPVRDQWLLLDPTSQFETSWNRAQSFITFNWTSADSALLIDNPSPDVIRISADPCSPSLKALGLKYVVSTHALASSCLREVAKVQWAGTSRFVFEAS